jgi:D-galactarolactone cycloisomerase
MKISGINVYILSSLLDMPFSFSQGKVTQRSSVIVKITLDNGIIGWGESLCHGQQPPEIAAAIIEYCYKPRLLGENPFKVDVLWEWLYNLTRPFGQGGAVVNALSSVDIALYDCLGKYLGQPVYNLLGGAYRNKVETYATGFYWKDGDVFPDCWIREAQGYISKGFKGVKLKTGFGVDRDIEYIQAVKETLPDTVKLLTDFNCAYTQGDARRLLKHTEESEVFLYEELLPPEDIEGYCAIRNLTPSYIAAGENILSKYEFKRWLSRGALDIYQPDLCSSGGFTECRKILTLAQSYHARLMPHVWGSGIGLAASLQFLAAVSFPTMATYGADPLLEFDQSEHPFRTELIFNGISMDKDGFVAIPDKPGIGVEINVDVLKEYSKEIHLL